MWLQHCTVVTIYIFHDLTMPTTNLKFSHSESVVFDFHFSKHFWKKLFHLVAFVFGKINFSRKPTHFILLHWNHIWVKWIRLLFQDCDTPVDERDCDVRVTCDDMKDDYKSCSRWAQNGYCEISSAHYTFMKDHCARTCQFCIKTQKGNENILGDKSDLVSNRQWRIYYDTSKHEDYSDVVDLGMMTRQEIKLLGHQQDEFIIQCTFDGKTCSKDWFKEFQNDMYGNCWTFNDGSQNAELLWNISQAGVRHALQLTVFLDVANYLGILSHRTGARLSIQDPRVQPFPDELGITLTPGKHTSIGELNLKISDRAGKFK